jgi:serine/threonine protein kinase
MSHSSSQSRHGSLSGFRGSQRGSLPASSERTKRDIGSADDAFGETAPELREGILLAGRYLVLRRLGRGGFSDVYLAHDHELDRSVAIKRLLLSDVDPHFIKDEAKTLASLDHPAIVRIYDICNEPKHGYLVIMQYVPGPMLREVLTKPLSIKRAVEIAIRISGGLIHAHSRGVVHRDIKPTNILMSNEGEPLIADFGLALAPNAHCDPEGGTPRYMSPEQIRNETKRIGPSSDIFSTGILLYEMLAGRVPFNGETAEAISRATLEQSITPINELNADVPVELDRIVRRALRKNVKDRYSSMEAFQAELIQWSSSVDAKDELSTLRTAESDRNQSLDSTFASSAFNSIDQFTRRGLQPFESEDAKFFLSLVPGARAPNGLPESVQYWKDWIEGYDNSEYGRIGVLYGPSGSGKTSLLRAGIVPYLAPDLLPIHIECRKGESIAQYASQIARQVNGESEDLAQLLLQLRDNPATRTEHRKVVLLFDQFDNWAGSASVRQLRQLAAALRHCDGESLQALLIVRDDFWTAATEFMRLVECGVEQWKNARSIELLDRHHARRLLEAAGRGFGSLPPNPEALNSEQASFINKAIDEMSVKGRVLPIQLAMFAKIAKLQSWRPETLSQVGGVQGAYIVYFQDLFESTTAPPNYQRVSSSVVEILHSLLPNADQAVHSHQVEFGTLEKTLADKGLQNQLHRSLSILVEDLRLVVRISQPASESSTEYAIQCNDRFHLVHDFLVIPIANWVDQVRKSSWRGRAIARLEELSAMWNRKPHNRFLPTLPEFVAMQVASPTVKRSSEQRRFLRRAAQRHLLQAMIVLAVISPIGAIVYSVFEQRQRNFEDHQKQVFQKFERTIRGDAREFIDLLKSELDEDQATYASASQPWLDSAEMKFRTRSRLLSYEIHKTSFRQLSEDLGKFEPQLSRHVIEVARKSADAKPLLLDLIHNASALNAEKARAAITLACLNETEHILRMLDDTNGSIQTNLFLNHALEWDADPFMWSKLALSRNSACATYYSLCVLGSYPEADLPTNLPWSDLATLQSSSDAGVSVAAKWLLEKTPAAREFVTLVNSSQRRILSCGMEQVRVAAGKPNRRITRVNSNIDLSDTEKVIDKPFWLSCAAVTNAEFEAFRKEFDIARSDVKPIERTIKRNSNLELNPDRAITGMNAILVLEFCNWLSRREGLTPAYEILQVGDDDPARVRVIEGATVFSYPRFRRLHTRPSLVFMIHRAHRPRLHKKLSWRSGSFIRVKENR